MAAFELEVFNYSTLSILIVDGAGNLNMLHIDLLGLAIEIIGMFMTLCMFSIVIYSNFCFVLIIVKQYILRYEKTLITAI